MSPAAPSLTPVLVYADIAAAQEFLVRAFGFTPGALHLDEGGRALHGEVSLGEEVLWLHRVAPDHGLRSVPELGAASGMLNVRVQDVDAHHTRAAAAGATITSPPADQPYGQREYSALDSEGRPWSFATPA